MDPKDMLVADAHLDVHEITILKLTRFFFQSFAVPHSHAWIGCLEEAQSKYGESHGMLLAGRLLTALKEMRCTRQSMFWFNAPTCPGCASILTEHERRMIKSLAALRRGREGAAKTELMMLCEGNDTTNVVVAFAHLAMTLPRPADIMETTDAFKATC